MFFSTEIGQGTEEMKIAEHTCINHPQRDKHRLTLATGSGCFFFLSRMPACVLIEHFLVRLPWQSAPFLVLVVTQRGEHCAVVTKPPPDNNGWRERKTARDSDGQRSFKPSNTD